MPKKKNAETPNALNKEASIHNILSLMKEKGISEKDISNGIGVHIKTVRNWLSGKTFPEINHALALSLLFDIPLLSFVVINE
jgi:transcriptional regulator with XRE-family HTH domain